MQGIERVVFDGEQKSIRGVVSAEGEQVSLLRPVQIVADVEVGWEARRSTPLRSTCRHSQRS